MPADESKGWRVLETFNGVRVSTLAGLYKAWRLTEAPFLEFGFSGRGRAIVLAREAVAESEARLLRLHGIPSSGSPGVVAAADNGHGDSSAIVSGSVSGRAQSSASLALAPNALAPKAHTTAIRGVWVAAPNASSPLQAAPQIVAAAVATALATGEGRKPAMPSSKAADGTQIRPESQSRRGRARSAFKRRFLKR